MHSLDSTSCKSQNVSHRCFKFEYKRMLPFRGKHVKKLFIEALRIPFGACAITSWMLNTLCVRVAAFIYFFLFHGFRIHRAPISCLLLFLIWFERILVDVMSSVGSLAWGAIIYAYFCCFRRVLAARRLFLYPMFIHNNSWSPFFFSVCVLAKWISQRNGNNNKKYELHVLAVGNSSHCRFAIVVSGENKLYLRRRLLCGWYSGVCVCALWAEEQLELSFCLLNCLQKSNHKNMFWKLLQFHKWHSLERNLYVRSIRIHIVHRASFKFPMHLFFHPHSHFSITWINENRKCMPIFNWIIHQQSLHWR